MFFSQRQFVIMDLDHLVGIFGLLFVVAIAARVYLVYRENGRLPVTLKTGDTAHDFVHKILAGIVSMQAINILIFRAQGLSGSLIGGSPETFYRFLVPLHALETTTVQGIGLLLSYLGLLWVVIAQNQMGKDWRVGNNPKHETSLVTRGLYGRLRHPIYSGFIVISIGLFFAVPNVVTLVCAVLTVIVLSIEARLEEDFQLTRHGDAYKDYLSTTRRWI